MQLNQLKPSSKNRKSRRIARGGKRGGYSGRGIKGQRSRAGAKIRPAIRDMIKRIPKRRGYKFHSIKNAGAVINVGDLEKVFRSGDVITPGQLLKLNLVKMIKGKIPLIKVLGVGSLTKKLTLSDVSVSQSAKAKIQKAGGVVN